MSKGYRRRRPPSRTASALLPLAVAVLILVAGCGGDASSDQLAQEQALDQARQEGAQTARQNQRIRELERQLRQQGRPIRQRRPVPSAGASPTPAAPSSYVAATGPTPSDPTYGYVAEVPVGGGWSSPTESHPTSGALLRTSWRGPDGTLLIIDRTPAGPAARRQLRRGGTVSQPAFGEATKYNSRKQCAAGLQRPPVRRLPDQRPLGRGLGRAGRWPEPGGGRLDRKPCHAVGELRGITGGPQRTGRDRDRRGPGAKETGEDDSAGVVVVGCAAAVGAGAYFVGKSTGEDLEAAQTVGTRAGERAGTAKGTKQGYAAGFAQGRKKGYERAYGPAYRVAYTETLDEAGYKPTEKEMLASLPTEPCSAPTAPRRPVLAAGAVGYVVGSGAATTPAEESGARQEAYDAAYASAVDASRAQAFGRGRRAGRATGRERGVDAGRAGGSADAQADVHKRRAAEAAEAAEATAAAEAAVDPCAPGNGHGDYNVPGSYISPEFGYCVPPNGIEPEG